MGRCRGAARAVLVAGALVALVAGCGGDDDSPAGDTSPATSTTVVVDRSTWSERLDAACSELDADHSDLAVADPTDRAGAIEYAAQVSDFADELEAILDEAGVPSQDRSSATALSDRVEELAEAAADLAAAARRGDVEQTREATRRLTAAGEAINPLAEGLDVPSCSGF